MTAQNLAILLTAYCLVVVALSIAVLTISGRRLVGTVLLLLALTGLVIANWIGTELSGQNFAFYTVQALFRLSRVETTAFAFGVFSALPLCALLLPPSDRPRSFLVTTLVTAGALGAVTFGTLLTARDLISAYLPNPNAQFASAGLGQVIAAGFSNETYMNTELIPIRVAVSPSGRVFVSGHRGIAAQEGGVVELARGENGAVEERLIARMLNRPYGLIATDDALFVSRSGQYTKWDKGRAEQISTGAVTMLRDIDGDGVMDYYDDVVSGLPGAKGPDFLHQNNGIALGTDGALYITTANHADGHPVADELAGAILRARGPNYSDVDLFASGLRNPFGLAFDSEGHLFATDNDSQSGPLGGNLGDKLLVVSEGDFFGHPYATDNTPGVTKPLLRSSFALGGITLATSEDLPAEYYNALFVVIYGEGRIMQIVETQEGDVTLKQFAIVPGAVDIAAAPNGDFYVAVYPDRIVRLRFIGQTQ